MKRLFCFVLVLGMALLLFFSTALAESAFELRNGIHFGDTEDVVRQKEKTLTESTNEADRNHYYGKIAGYNDAECVYFFDDDGKLNEMLYGFNKALNNKERTNDIYKDLYNSLCRKYGKPLGNTGGSCHIITGKTVERLAIMVYLMGGIDGWDGDYIDYDEWVVDDGNEHVKIDLAAYYYRDSKYNYSYWLDVSYKYFTDEDLKAKQDEKRAEQAEVDNDM